MPIWEDTCASVPVAGNINVVGAERIMGCNDDADRSIHTRELFDSDDVIHIAETSAAVFGREDHSHQSHSSKLLDDGERKLRFLVPLHDVRTNFGLGKLANRALELLLLFCELEVH